MNKKLINILATFSKKQLKNLALFLNSPYFNTNKQLINLFDILKKYHPDFNHRHFSSQKIFEQLFPGQSFNQAAITKISSKLYKQVATFTTVEALQQDNFQQNTYLLAYGFNKQLANTIDSQIRNMEKQLDTMSSDFLFQQYEIEKWRTAFLSQQDDRLGDINLQNVSNALDAFYFEKKLYYLCEMLNRQRTVHVQYQLVFLNEILHLIEESTYINNPKIKAYYLVLKLLSGKKEAVNFQNLKNFLSNNHDKFTTSQNRVFFTYLENQVRSYFTGKEYYQQLLKLYQQQIKMGFLDELPLPHTWFKNIVTVALSVTKVDYSWVFNFVETYRDKILPTSYQTDAYTYNLANIYFHKQAYERVNAILLTANPSDIYYKLSVALLQAKTLYELHDLDLLETALNNFSRRIHYYKNKIADSKIDSYRKFINNLNTIGKLIQQTPKNYYHFCNKQAIKDRDTQEALKALQTKLRADTMFYGKKWLIAKVEALSNGK